MAESIVAHIEAWDKIDYKYGSDDLKDLEWIYKQKAPASAWKKAKKQDEQT